MSHFERAVFLSWYCSRGDCKFCYMSTQKALIKNPRKARRSVPSVLAEVLICRELGWKIEFLSGGYDSFTHEELVDICRKVSQVYGKTTLNIGVIPEDELKDFVPFIDGVCGAVEIINPELHQIVCPSKPLEEVESFFAVADKFGLKKSMTMIVGLGESKDDLLLLKEFIQRHSIDRITFYRLKPQKGTSYTQGPRSEDYVWWVSNTRRSFPDIEIVVGSWITHLDEIHLLLQAGASAVTKFPSIRRFGSVDAEKIESECNKVGSFDGSLTVLPDIDWGSKVEGLPFDSSLKSDIYSRLQEYLKNMKRKD